METLTLQHQRKRKAMLVLPLVVLVLITVIFQMLGGGNADTGNHQGTTTSGFNTQLPDARLNDEQGLNKLSFYDRAAADSAKLRQAQQADPYTNHQADSAARQDKYGNPIFSPHQPEAFSERKVADAGTAADKAVLLNKRLTALQAAINKPPVITVDCSGISANTYPPVKAITRNTRQMTAAPEDPELKQMNGLLDKLLDLQHPDRVIQKTAKSDIASAEQFRAIPAVIDGNQKIVQGTVIRMRLQDSVRLNGQLFLKGQLIYGSGDLYNQRVKVNIKLIHIGLNIIPVDLTVYDRTDGLEGICVPEAVTNEALKDGMLNGMQNVDMMNMDPSMTAQLATAGINTAKRLFSKKVKQAKGKLKNGHELLLRNNLLRNAGNQRK